MNPEKQLIAIAEACGWRRLYVCINSHAGCVIQWWRQLDNQDTDTTSLPDYPNDLNAMHEAEKVLADTQENDQWSKYCFELNKISCKRIQCGNTHTCGYTIAATAAQRAEAFLRTIGKWEE